MGEVSVRNGKVFRHQTQTAHRGKPGVPTAQSYLVKAGRMRLGITQAELAERTGLSLSFMSDVERGRRVLTNPETIARVAALFDTDPDEFYFTANRVPPDILLWLQKNPRITRNLRAMKRKMEAAGE